MRADEVDEQGNTALHLAAQGDHKEVSTFKLSHFQTCKLSKFKTFTILHFQVISLLLQRREGTMCVNKEGLTALHLASSAGSLSCIQV